MKDINEENLLSYLNSFKQSKDYDIFLKDYLIDYDYDDTNIFDNEYINLVKYYNKLLNLKDSLNYRIEVGPHCTFLIGKLFERYVDNETFVLTTEQEHPSVRYYLKDNTYIVYVNELKRKDIIKQIIKKYKESKYTKFFLIMQGVISGSAEFIDESFFKSLKLALEKEKIPHIFVLDDCQGLYMTNREYSVFDAILGTAHALIKYGIEMGILYTKLSKKIGYINKQGLKDFAYKLQFVLNHRQDAFKFHDLIKKFLLDEIDNNTLKINDNQAKHMLVVSTDGVKFSQKHADEMEKYNIIFSELNTIRGVVRLRYIEAILYDPLEYINTLKKFKKILHSLKRMKEFGTDLEFNGDKNLNYNIMVNGTNINISEVNKKKYESSFKDQNLNEDSFKEINKVKQQIKFHYIFNHSR